MNIEKAITIPGWSSEEELKFIASIAKKSSSIVEIGSWRGRTARTFADNTNGHIICVDTWADDAYGNPGWWTEKDGPDFCKHQDWLLQAFNANLSEHIPSKVTCLRMTSLQASSVLVNNRYDCIFIDAGHDYKSVREDILAWRPLLVEGGVFMGHDYNPHAHPEVVQVVNELIGNIEVVDTIWIAK